MTERLYSTDHVDYLQRSNFEPELLSPGSVLTSAPPQCRRLFQIAGIGLFEKQWDARKQQIDGRRFRLPTEDAITSLYGYKLPVAFLVEGKPEGVAVHLGIWSPERQKTSPETLDSWKLILRASLNSLYSSVDYVDAQPPSKFPLGGLVLGTPTAKAPDAQDGARQLDRLIRALSGSSWACLVIAQPMDDTAIADMRNQVFNEMRIVQSSAKAEDAPSPLAGFYVKLLKPLSKTLSSAQAAGGWRTAVYLLGEKDSYSRLASVWRGIYSGDDSLPEPVRVFDLPYVAKLAADWAMPDTPWFQGPGQYQNPLAYQTILSSRQLATYIHLPQLETGGFGISQVPSFDAVPHPPGEGAATIEIGKIVVRGYETETRYQVELDALTKHVFIPGVTGAGKTNTIFHLLKQAWAAKIPFLVIEPAKTEYRELRNHSELGGRLRVFTLGDENVSPLRLNPFELVHPTTPLSLHIDLLRSVFTHSFGLWNPLPQILEECLYLIYADKGWDVTGGFNRRTKVPSDPRAFPTMTDLVTKVQDVTQRLKWDPEAKGRIQGALRDKLKGLSHGGRGRMLDVQQSIPMDELMENPTILELESLGDEDDKAFLMGLLLIRLWEYRRAKAANDGKNKLRHLLVFEEAHRLLTNTAANQQQGEGNARAKAVESFTNLLSEIRSYGEGVIIADQVPVKLAPDVIKNTNLKISHRIVDAEDRKVLAGSMHMTEQQAEAPETFLPGRTAVFMEGDDAPLLVQIPPPAKADAEARPLAEEMARWRVKYRDLFARHPGCTDVSEHGGASCDAARSLVETPSFRRDLNRLVLSVLADSGAAERLWVPIDQSLNLLVSPYVNRDIMLQCVVSRAARFYASKLGFQLQWSFDATTELANYLESFLFAVARKAPKEESLNKFRECYLRLNLMPLPYYSRCQKICNSQPARCLFRSAVSEVVETAAFNALWEEARPRDPANVAAAWGVCMRVANLLVEHHENQTKAFNRIGLCYGQMMLAGIGGDATSNAASVAPPLPPETRDELVDHLCEKAGPQTYSD